MEFSGKVNTFCHVAPRRRRAADFVELCFKNGFDRRREFKKPQPEPLEPRYPCIILLQPLTSN